MHNTDSESIGISAASIHELPYNMQHISQKTKMLARITLTASSNSSETILYSYGQCRQKSAHVELDAAIKKKQADQNKYNKL